MYYYYPVFSTDNVVAHSAFQGSNSCRVVGYPFTTPGAREKIVGKMPRLGPTCRGIHVYAPSGIRTHDPLIASREHKPLHRTAPTTPQGDTVDL